MSRLGEELMRIGSWPSSSGIIFWGQCFCYCYLIFPLSLLFCFLLVFPCWLCLLLCMLLQAGKQKMKKGNQIVTTMNRNSGCIIWWAYYLMILLLCRGLKLVKNYDTVRTKFLLVWMLANSYEFIWNLKATCHHM